MDEARTREACFAIILDADGQCDVDLSGTVSSSCSYQKSPNEQCERDAIGYADAMVHMCLVLWDEREKERSQETDERSAPSVLSGSLRMPSRVRFVRDLVLSRSG